MKIAPLTAWLVAVVFLAIPGSALANPRDEIKRAQELYDSMEFGPAIPILEQVLATSELEMEIKLEAYVLLAKCRAIVGDTIGAEAPFRLLLRAESDFELPEDTPPKIMAVFRKVQAEEQAINRQLEALRRKRLIDSLAFLGEPPERANGGEPLHFSFRLRDPSSVVEAVSIPYRRQREPSFSALALKRDQEGAWRGTISGEWTATETGFDLEFYVQTLDATGPLLTLGSEVAPLTLEVMPGLVETRLPKPIPRWAFWTGVGTTGVIAATAGGVALALLKAKDNYDRFAAIGLQQVIPGAELTAMRRSGQDLALATNVLLVAASVVAALTLASLPFVPFGEEIEAAAEN